MTMRLLIVKTSSMGDVVHAMPVVHDILRVHPSAHIEWLVEAPFAAIPAMHPGVAKVLPMAWRKWRSELAKRRSWRAMRELRDELRDGHFDLALDLRGTPFQLRVWHELLTIGYGEVRSYAAVAAAIGAPQAFRAVGAANGANPVPIIVPCHRLVGSGGALIKYGGGLAVKRRLLDLERGQ